MKPEVMPPESVQAEVVSAWATGAGVGLVVLMVAWLIGNRSFALLWEAPVGPTVAIITATLAGIGTAVTTGRRLVRSLLE